MIDHITKSQIIFLGGLKATPEVQEASQVGVGGRIEENEEIYIPQQNKIDLSLLSPQNNNNNNNNNHLVPGSLYCLVAAIYS